MNIEAKILDKILGNRTQRHLKDHTPWSSGFSLGEAVVSQSASWTLPLASPLGQRSQVWSSGFPLTYTLPLDAPNHVFNARLYDEDFSTYIAQPRHSIGSINLMDTDWHTEGI